MRKIDPKELLNKKPELIKNRIMGKVLSAGKGCKPRSSQETWIQVILNLERLKKAEKEGRWILVEDENGNWNRTIIYRP